MAGSWYPAAADRLEFEVARHLSAVSNAGVPPPRAIVVPHAGLHYSGPVAAFAYHAIGNADYATVLLVGPSHFVGFTGVSIWPRGAWQTPFGAVRIDEELAGTIAAASADIIENREAHRREHSLEMQLPFITYLLPGVPIVPMVMGYQSRDTALGLGETLARALAGRKALLVASSDLSHYEDARTAAAMDGVVLRHVEQLDDNGLMEALEREPHHACGGGPIVSVLHAAKQLGAAHAQVLRYADSGDVSGDKSSVVGYMAAAIW